MHLWNVKKPEYEMLFFDGLVKASISGYANSFETASGCVQQYRSQLPKSQLPLALHLHAQEQLLLKQTNRTEFSQEKVFIPRRGSFSS